MRILLLLLLVPIAALPDPLDCHNAGVNPGVLTSQQWDALLTSAATSDPILLESRFLFSRESRPISAREMHNATPISWETGRKLILLGSVNRIFKAYPEKTIYLATRSGRVYASTIVGEDDVISTVVKFAGYTAAAYNIKKRIPESSASPWVVGSVRTAIGLGAGMGAVYAANHLGILKSEFAWYALLAPIRICEWLLLLALFFRRPTWDWTQSFKLALLGTLWSYVLDIPATLAVFVIPGGAWIC